MQKKLKEAKQQKESSASVADTTSASVDERVGAATLSTNLGERRSSPRTNAITTKANDALSGSLTLVSSKSAGKRKRDLLGELELEVLEKTGTPKVIQQRLTEVRRSRVALERQRSAIEKRIEEAKRGERRLESMIAMKSGKKRKT